MQQHGSKYFSRTPTPSPYDLEMMGSKLNFTEHVNVAYEIKENHEMQQHGSKYFVRRPPDTPTPYPRPWGRGQ